MMFWVFLFLYPILLLVPFTVIAVFFSFGNVELAAFLVLLFEIAWITFVIRLSKR